MPQPAVRARKAVPALRWGDHRGRSAVGPALLIAGAVLIAQTSAATMSMGLVGSLLHLAGWVVEPGRIRHRALVALPSTLACWTTVSGTWAAWLLVICLAAWLVVRRRPAIAYLALFAPIATGFAVGAAFPETTDKGLAVAAVGASIVGGAWLGQELGSRAATHAPAMNPPAQAGAEHRDAA